MKNWKIGIRIGAGFASIILTTVALGLFALNRDGNIGKSTEDLRSISIPSLIELLDVQADQYHSVASLLQLVPTQDPLLIQKLSAEIAALRKSQEKSLRAYDSTPFTGEEASAYNASKITRVAFLAKFDEVLKAGRSTDPESSARAQVMFEQELRPLSEKYSSELQTLVDINKQQTDVGLTSTQSSVTSTSYGIWSGIALCIAISIPISFFIMRSITVPIGLTVETLGKVAVGDLTARLDWHSKDEIGQMAEALNATLKQLRSVLQEVAGSAANSNSSSRELAAAAEQIATGAQEQAVSLEETSASLEEITAAVRQTADNAKQASQLATDARESAEQGQEVVSNAIAAMAEINAASAKIADITSTINEIAFQTNLLAVNAAVEAARAGEEGRGFAVVATEVRSLAQRSAEAAKEIKGLIQDSLRKVEKGTDLVNRSGATLQGIVGSVGRVTVIVGEIASASSEQSIGVEQVNTAITQMDQVTRSNSARTEELSSMAQVFAGQAERQTHLVRHFKLGNDEQSRRNNDLKPLHHGQPSSTPRRPAKPPTNAAAGKLASSAQNGRKHFAQSVALVGSSAGRSDDASFEESRC